MPPVEFSPESRRPVCGERRSALGGRQSSCNTGLAMTEPNRKYKWPWFVLAAVILFIALAVMWMFIAVHKEERQRDFGTPLPASAPAK